MTLCESLFNFPGEFTGDSRRLRHPFDDPFGAVGLPADIREVAPRAFPAINIGNLPQSLEIYAFAPPARPRRIEVRAG